MAQKWNLQDIRPAGTAKSVPRSVASSKARLDISPRIPAVEREELRNDPDLANIDVIDGNSEKRKRVIITATIACVIIAFGFLINVLLGGATVTIHPKLKNISVQATFTAYTNPKVNELGYELLTLETSGERQVKAGGKETVSTRAEGTIFVYNTKSTSPQRLIKNTRFENKDGLIYRIKESIEVPGATKDAKGNLVPGSITAEVFSDGTGEQYNIAPTRFSVPGLKGSDQFDNVYGESSSPFVGGFDGEKYIIDEDELATAKQALHLELRDLLLKELSEKKPAGFVVYDDAVTISFVSQPSTEYGESLATIKETAHLQVPMFKESEFSAFIAEKTIPDYTGDPVSMIDPNAVAFSYTIPTTTVSNIAQKTSIEFNLKGNSQIVWTFDEEKLQNELMGIKKNAATGVFSSYTSISNAQAEVRPFWSSTFPEKAQKIIINTVLESKE